MGGLVALSAVVRFLLARSYPGPWTWTDELLYGELSKSFAATGHFALREVPGRAGFGIVYPLLISPAYWLFTSVPAAYSLMQGINALVMSLGAVPTYLLARRLAPRPLALLAAVLALALPDLAYTAGIMTENAFFTVFLFWCWALVRALETPTVVRQLGVLALLLLAYLTRPQAVTLAPALLTAIVLVTLVDALAARERFGRALLGSARRFIVTWAIFGVGGAAYLFFELSIRGKTWGDALFGPTYAQLASENYSATTVWHWFIYHVGVLAFSVAVIPFAALLLLIAGGLDPRERRRELRVFAVVAFSASFWLVLGVAAFASTPFAGQLEERNVFYVTPLFLVALIGAIGSGLIWQRRTLSAVAAVATVGCVAIPPFGSFLGPTAANQNFSVLPLETVLERHIVGIAQLQTAIILGAVAAAMLFLLVPRRLALVLPAVVLLAFTLANAPIHHRTATASQQARLAGASAQRDWIDRAVGTKPVVTALWSGSSAFVTLWANEFFNRSVGPVYNFHGPPDGLPQRTAVLQPNGAVTFNGRPVRAAYVLADRTMIVGSERIAEDAGTGMTVYRVDGPVTVKGQLEGLYADGWSGPTAAFTIYGCEGGTLSVTLLGDAALNPQPQTVTATSGSRLLAQAAVRPGREARFEIPLVAKKHVCDGSLAVTPTAVPALTIGTPDTRELGIRMLRPAYSPS